MAMRAGKVSGAFEKQALANPCFRVLSDAFQ